MLPPITRSLLDWLTSRLGLVVLPAWRAVRLDEERHLSRLLRYLEVDLVLDVGANVGQYGLMLRRHAQYRGRLISFEPDPKPAATLRKVSGPDPLWDVEPLALGSRPGRASFNAMPISLLSSFRNLDKQSPYKPDQLDGQVIEVQVTTLENYLEDARRRFAFSRPFLKMDTQGFDLDVAKGAGASIDDFAGIQTEIAFETIYQGAPSYREAFDFYASRGFRLSRLVPIHDAHFPHLVEMDAIFLNEKFALHSARASKGG